jgi:hypothetical protein
MTIVGHDNESFETALYICWAAISGLLFFVQVIYLQQLRMIPVYLLPIVSACICFENSLLAGGRRSEPDWRISQFVNAIEALILPFLVLIIFEMPFRLHQARTAHFLCIPFEQGEYMSKDIGNISLWSMRLISVGLFVIKILVNFNLINGHGDDTRVGFVAFGDYNHNIQRWMSLLPTLFLSFESVSLSLVMQRSIFLPLIYV